ncbi:acetylxylan esterase [Streptomyces sp. TRM72054]|uniref:alpha/beta hydrolase family protein n=1 Tax=Streptomyces sp. TRM72054 TaxID=2870562 RepID=UPI001C8BE9BA|nr:alpha/beta hydrolase [Streptomyces sp. TRM72054]MBX9398991.1 acetylxylan esterase [Streptomyces sp. TRM72054]
MFRAAPTHRPLLIATNGYDATIYDMYLGLAVPSLRRGYHCLLFDGPGQGSVLFEQGIPIRHDWETVVTSVVDQVVCMPEVDQRRIALSGWSLGGYLALRAASGEERLAAVIADPGLYSISAGAIGRLRAAGVAEDILARFPDSCGPDPAMGCREARVLGTWRYGPRCLSPGHYAVHLGGEVALHPMPRPGHHGGSRHSG